MRQKSDERERQRLREQEARREQEQQRQRREQEAGRELERQFELQQRREGAIQSVVISTGDLKSSYTIIDTVFALDSQGTAGIFFGADGNPHAAFEGVKQKLRERAVSLGADAIIICQFEYRVAVAGEGHSARQAVEMFAYGTAVKTHDG
jgi:hypothetical protein